MLQGTLTMPVWKLCIDASVLCRMFSIVSTISRRPSYKLKCTIAPIPLDKRKNKSKILLYRNHLVLHLKVKSASF